MPVATGFSIGNFFPHQSSVYLVPMVENRLKFNLGMLTRASLIVSPL